MFFIDLAGIDTLDSDLVHSLEVGLFSTIKPAAQSWQAPVLK
jgi:hypothetical protein